MLSRHIVRLAFDECLFENGVDGVKVGMIEQTIGLRLINEAIEDSVVDNEDDLEIDCEVVVC